MEHLHHGPALAGITWVVFIKYISFRKKKGRKLFVMHGFLMDCPAGGNVFRFHLWHSDEVASHFEIGTRFRSLRPGVARPLVGCNRVGAMSSLALRGGRRMAQPGLLNDRMTVWPLMRRTLR